MGWQDTERGHTGMAGVLNKAWMDRAGARMYGTSGRGLIKTGAQKERSKGMEEDVGCIDRRKPYVWEEPAKNWGGRMKMFGGKE